MACQKASLGREIYSIGQEKARTLTFTLFLGIMLILESKTKDRFMAQHKSAEKRARTSLRHAARSMSVKSKMRTVIKRVRSLKDKQLALTELRKATKLLDQLAAKRIIHRNNAANTKSRLTKYVNTLP